ncbi:Hypothetical Protein PANA_0522 [Pantoea ananatis LMG 20103]|uniref:Response receiver domain-containing protein n=1 Tax=Pantoea ananatis (strain LMG 20103) TaxID=706191 RepID=D4GIU4_PANAM|nr:hypothetical protein [Pantoea ananatis]ADD75689.1 Hypothetical Protein PANA_0522 [Pantoea ananatis LMG 20103]
MSNIRELVNIKKIKKALLIDDSYNKKPKKENISYSDDWDLLFSDLTVRDIEIIKEKFPDYENIEVDALKESDEFIAILWDLRDQIQSCTPFFERYISDTNYDLELLNHLKKKLCEYNIEVTQIGIPLLADSSHKAILKNPEIDLIFIDLFLGGSQDSKSKKRSIDTIKHIIKERENSPPLVILISRSPSLESSKIEFRDETLIIESMFRILPKIDIKNDVKFEQILYRLIYEIENSKKIVNFINSWKRGINSSLEKTLATMRSLDLSTYSKLKELLLDGEGESTGNYIVDVFEHIMQHNIEEDSDIINSAIRLNDLGNSSTYYPYITKDKNLHTLLYSVLFKNNNRAKISSTDGKNLRFGDIISICSLENADEKEKHYLIDRYNSEDVFIVITPACDLQRCSVYNVLLLKGKISNLSLNSWIANDNEIITPIVKIDDEFKSIKWDVKSIETLLAKDISNMLENNFIKKIATLRENAALSIQQNFLASVGRVGLIAPMPASYIVKLELFYLDKNKKLKKIDLTENNSPQENFAICYVGRYLQEKNSKSITLSEELAENIRKSICDIDIEDVYPKTKKVISIIKDSVEIQHKLCRQLRIDRNKATSIELMDEEMVSKIGYIIENPDVNAMNALSGKQDAAIVIVIKQHA